MLLIKIADDTRLGEGKNNSKDMSIHEFELDYLVGEALLSIYRSCNTARYKAMAWQGQFRTGWHWELLGSCLGCISYNFAFWALAFKSLQPLQTFPSGNVCTGLTLSVLPTESTNSYPGRERNQT